MSGIEIGRNVKAAREALGLTQAELVERVPSAKIDTLRKLEQGKIDNPRNLAEYADALGVPETQLRYGAAVAPASTFVPDEETIPATLLAFLATPLGQTVREEEKPALKAHAYSHGGNDESFALVLAAGRVPSLRAIQAAPLTDHPVAENLASARPGRRRS